MSYLRIGIDVGGTFTDLVGIDQQGHTVFAKSPSTPADQSLGVMAGLEELARRHQQTLSELLAATERIVHGTTVATNALLERKGARVALLTTEGHRDVLEMREGLKGNRYDLRSPPPEPLVPRRLRFGVRERLGANGGVRIPLDQESLTQAIESIRAAGATSVAICYLHAYKNPEHEIATAEHLQRELPGVFISRSSDVLPQIKEFERVSTTVVNAYVGPAVRLYLKSLERRLKESGFAGSLYITLSHGGMAPLDEACRLAAATVLSGPAGGVAGARRCAAMLNVPDLIPFDMGGTSTDISLISNGQAALSAERGIGDERIALRSLDIVSIGAGGGSIAHVDGGGSFHVGPESAGAVPGPACYGRGGDVPAVTDANLLLGYLDPATFLGGRFRLDRVAAERVVDRLALQLNLSRDATALGMFRLINLKMADGIRLMTLRRGVDPRRFALLSFGGAAGVHAVEVARELEIRRVMIPTVASVLSAWGMLGSDLRYEASRTHIGEGGVMDDAKLRAIYADLERHSLAHLQGWSNGAVRMERSAEMRYGEQIFEIDVPLDGIDWDAPKVRERMHEAFHRRHEELYTYAQRDQEVVFVNARVSAVLPAAPATQSRVEHRRAATTGEPRTRLAHFAGEWRQVPVYPVDELPPGTSIIGPAIFEAETTTVIINAGDELSVNDFGWLDIQLRQN